MSYLFLIVDVSDDPIGWIESDDNSLSRYSALVGEGKAFKKVLIASMSIPAGYDNVEFWRCMIGRSERLADIRNFERYVPEQKHVTNYRMGYTIGGLEPSNHKLSINDGKMWFKLGQQMKDSGRASIFSHLGR